MTNAPLLTTPFQHLIDHIARGSQVRVGDWKIKDAKPLQISGSFLENSHRFIANVSCEAYEGGREFEAAISLKPTAQENLTGMLVDLSVEIRSKFESNFPGVPFATPVGVAKPQHIPRLRNVFRPPTLVG